MSSSNEKVLALKNFHRWCCLKVKKFQKNQLTEKYGHNLTLLEISETYEILRKALLHKTAQTKIISGQMQGRTASVTLSLTGNRNWGLQFGIERRIWIEIGIQIKFVRKHS